MCYEPIKVMIRQADDYDKIEDPTEGGRGCKI